VLLPAKCKAGIIVRRAHPETYLRLACESLLAGERGTNPFAVKEVSAVARALIAAGTLDEATARSVLDEYTVAVSVRQVGPPLARPPSGRAPGGDKVDLSASRAVTGRFPIGDDGAGLLLHRLVFADDTTHVELSGTGRDRIGSALGQPAGGGRLPAVTVMDDQGRTASATGRTWHNADAGWSASFVTDKPLAASTSWLDIDGGRVDLPPQAPPPVARTEDVPAPADPVKAMVYRELTDSVSRRGGDTLGGALAALIATGALSQDDPLVAEVEQVTDAMVSQRAVTSLPEPWASLLRRFGKRDGPVGTVPIGAAVSSADGWSVRFDSLESDEGHFTVFAAVSPGRVLLNMPFDPLTTSTYSLEWRAEDDRGNSYLAIGESRGGTDNVADGELVFLSPLDPKARELRLLATGRRQRAVVTISLEGLGTK
jgi:hypothetical protein